MYSYEKYVKLCHELRQKKPSPIAEEAGVHKSLISRWKSGGGITDSSALRLAECLGVDVSFLKGEEQKENPTSPKADEVDGAVAQELYDMVHAATEEERLDMLEILRIYKGKKRRKDE